MIVYYTIQSSARPAEALASGRHAAGPGEHSGAEELALHTGNLPEI